MATGPRYSVAYKRKRKEKTNYKKRLALIKSGKHRLVVRKTNKRMIAQIVDFQAIGDKTLVSASSNDLKKYSFNNPNNNLPSAYLTGFLIAKIAIEKKIKSAVFDMGLNISSKGNKFYALLKGAIDGGLKIPCNELIFPSEERIKGEHIKGFDTSIVEKVKNAIIKNDTIKKVGVKKKIIKKEVKKKEVVKKKVVKKKVTKVKKE